MSKENWAAKQRFLPIFFFMVVFFQKKVKNYATLFEYDSNLGCIRLICIKCSFLLSFQ